MRCSSARVTCDKGDLSIRPFASGDVVAIDKYCIPLGKLGRRAGDGKEKLLDEVGDTSSNRSRTTTFGSARLRLKSLLFLDGVLLSAPLTEGLPCDRLSFDAVVSEYSGSSAKLDGVTTTPKVPGRCVSAFRSRSSSLVSVANAGKSS